MKKQLQYKHKHNADDKKATWFQANVPYNNTEHYGTKE